MTEGEVQTLHAFPPRYTWQIPVKVGRPVELWVLVSNKNCPPFLHRKGVGERGLHFLTGTSFEAYRRLQRVN